MMRGSAHRRGTATLPPEIGRVVIALCGDYDRRERALHRGDGAPEILLNYRALNRAIDHAIAKVCEEPIRHQVLRDIAERRGARRTPINTLSEGTYKRRKRESTYQIARELRLL